MNLLFYHAGALGDFLTALPVLLTWRRRYPFGRITLLSRPVHAVLAVDAGLADEVWDIDAGDAVLLFQERHKADTDSLLAVFDAAVIFASRDSPIIANARAAGIKVMWQPPFPDTPEPIADYHLSVLDGPSPDYRTACRMAPCPALAQEAGELTGAGDYVCIHPGSGSERKNWPVDRFTQAADTLRKQRLRIVWLRGPAEDHFGAMDNDVVLQNRSLRLLVQVLSRCRVFLGNDSGISHLAASSGCPGVVLFGASDPETWRPVGRRVTVVKGPAPCAPCHPGRHCFPQCGHRCMRAITVRAVVDACENLLSAQDITPH